MDDEKIYQIQHAVGRFRRSANRSRISTMGERLSNPKGSLATLVDNLNRINRLSQSLKVVLPEPLCDHCRITSMEENQLVIAVDSSEWASRLRYEKLELLSYLRTHGFANVNGIDIIVNPDDFKSS